MRGTTRDNLLKTNTNNNVQPTGAPPLPQHAPQDAASSSCTARPAAWSNLTRPPQARVVTATAQGSLKVDGALQGPSLAWPSPHSHGRSVAAKHPTPQQGLGGTGLGRDLLTPGTTGPSGLGCRQHAPAETAREGHLPQQVGTTDDAPERRSPVMCGGRAVWGGGAAAGSRREGDISGRDVRFVGHVSAGGGGGCRAALLWPRILSVTRRGVATCRIYSNKGTGTGVGGAPPRATQSCPGSVKSRLAGAAIPNRPPASC